MKENWKDIKGYEGLYQVSNLGRIKSLEFRNHKYNFQKEKILKPNKSGTCKYLAITLSKNKKRKRYLIHRLVAETFISNPYNFAQINHKDENKQNNCENNLEWCTRNYNMNYGTQIERAHKKQRKKINQYDLNGNFIKQWDSIADIIKELKDTNVYKCCVGKYKQSKGYIWKYANDTKMTRL